MRPDEELELREKQQQQQLTIAELQTRDWRKQHLN